MVEKLTHLCLYPSLGSGCCLLDLKHLWLCSKMRDIMFVLIPIQAFGLNCMLLHQEKIFQWNLQNHYLQKFKSSNLVLYSTFFRRFAACACRPLNMLWAWHTHLASLSNMYHTTSTLSFHRTHTCQQSNAYFKAVSLDRVPCGFGSLAMGYCLSMLLQSERDNCVACQIFVETFLWTIENLQNLRT